MIVDLGMKNISVLLIPLLVLACTSTPTIENFDKQAWISDPYGCKNQRIQQLEVIKRQEEKILSKSQNEIKELLGRPDEHELYQRTRKFFYYYLEPSDKCDSTLTDAPRILQIRFNALGLSNEVFVKNDY